MSVVFLALCSVFFVAMVVFAVRRAVRRDVVLLACVAGGLIAGCLEPILDYLGLLWFADDNAVIAIETVGRHIPLYVVMGYAFFFGAQAYIVYTGILARRPTSFFVTCYAVSWLFDLALQVTGAQFGLYEYYGNQPFMIFGAPAWWFTIDAGFDLIAGIVFYFILRGQRQGWRVLLAIPIIPCIYAGMNGAVGWPVFIALNSNYDAAVNGNGSDLLVWLGGAGTIALGLFVAALAIRAIGWIVDSQGAEADHESRPPRREEDLVSA